MWWDDFPRSWSKKESEEKGADRRTLPPMYGLSGAAAPSMSSFIYGSY